MPDPAAHTRGWCRRVRAAQCSASTTDESPGLKVDPVVVLVLSLVFIFSVVALHSKISLAPRAIQISPIKLTGEQVIAVLTRKFSS